MSRAFAAVLLSAAISAKILADVVYDCEPDILYITMGEVKAAHPAVIVALLLIFGAVAAPVARLRHACSFLDLFIYRTVVVGICKCNSVTRLVARH